MRRSSWCSPIYTGRSLPAVSFLGGGVHVGLAARVSVRGEKEGEEEQQVEGVALTTMGGPGREEGRGEGRGDTAAMAPVFPVTPLELGMTGGSPCQVLFFFFF